MYLYVCRLFVLSILIYSVCLCLLLIRFKTFLFYVNTSSSRICEMKIYILHSITYCRIYLSFCLCSNTIHVTKWHCRSKTGETKKNIDIVVHIVAIVKQFNSLAKAKRCIYSSILIRKSNISKCYYMLYDVRAYMEYVRVRHTTYIFVYRNGPSRFLVYNIRTYVVYFSAEIDPISRISMTLSLLVAAINSFLSAFHRTDRD